MSFGEVVQGVVVKWFRKWSVAAKRRKQDLALSKITDSPLLRCASLARHDKPWTWRSIITRFLTANTSRRWTRGRLTRETDGAAAPRSRRGGATARPREEEVCPAACRSRPAGSPCCHSPSCSWPGWPASAPGSSPSFASRASSTSLTPGEFGFAYTGFFVLGIARARAVQELSLKRARRTEGRSPIRCRLVIPSIQFCVWTPPSTRRQFAVTPVCFLQGYRLSSNIVCNGLEFHHVSDVFDSRHCCSWHLEAREINPTYIVAPALRFTSVVGFNKVQHCAWGEAWRVGVQPQQSKSRTMVTRVEPGKKKAGAIWLTKVPLTHISPLFTSWSLVPGLVCHPRPPQFCKPHLTETGKMWCLFLGFTV